MAGAPPHKLPSVAKALETMTAPAFALFSNASNSPSLSLFGGGSGGGHIRGVHYQTTKDNSRIRGWLLKKVDSKWTKFFFELKDDMLMQFEDDAQEPNDGGSSSPNDKPMICVKLQGAVISPIIGQDPFTNVFTWTLSTQTETFLLGTVNEEDRKRWLAALEKTIKKAGANTQQQPQPETPTATRTSVGVVESVPMPITPSSSSPSVNRSSLTSHVIQSPLDVIKRNKYRLELNRLSDEGHPNWMLSCKHWQEIACMNSCRIYNSHNTNGVVCTTIIPSSPERIRNVAFDVLHSRLWDANVDCVDLLSVDEFGVRVRLFERCFIPGQGELGFQNVFEFRRCTWNEQDGTRFVVSKNHSGGGNGYVSCFKIIPVNAKSCFVMYLVDAGPAVMRSPWFFPKWLNGNMQRAMALAGLRDFCAEFADA